MTRTSPQLPGSLALGIDLQQQIALRLSIAQDGIVALTAWERQDEERKSTSRTDSVVELRKALALGNKALEELSTVARLCQTAQVANRISKLTIGGAIDGLKGTVIDTADLRLTLDTLQRNSEQLEERGNKVAILIGHVTAKTNNHMERLSALLGLTTARAN